ncbi:pseudouridine-5-phosphate glycosidase [Candidatus Atribacteria bacterium RBG_19FT_COMBO_35_14]|uniref:Pseudouridine-5'-phosphate glycosidase n=1 Tax=Candidatus Sediminicultor quintus TaxID=1797291 RepID=A0A1F5ADE6_9BACT|nr:MAG: pseudouridine-5-phosphate glycosidase [Candidatus Atribacteria bacterium RBG_19FT_COMBO_35_14]
MNEEKLFAFKDEIKEALATGKPIVALESTLISHGFPYPENLEVAGEIEEIIRGYGVVPATIAIIGGKIKAGLTSSELEFMATSKDILKTSRRDLAVIAAKGLNGATTVAATMIVAERAGIKIFATGGIGGVHRGAEKTFDISADLQELARTPVVVVCSGAKAILDLPLTKEYLETMGVPVIGFGSEELPAFYCRESGLKVDYVAKDEVEAAKIIRAMEDLKLGGGIIIANPIPEEYAISMEYMNEKIEEAVRAAEKEGIKGKKLTPYLLNKIKELTGGKSLKANIELVKNNARVAAKIACELIK